MNKQLIGLVIATLFSAGCATKVIQTPGGPVECYSKKCAAEATTWARQHAQQVAKAEKMERKRQEQEAERAQDLAENPWKLQSYEQVQQTAKSNKVALFLIIRGQDGLLSVSGIDVANLEYGINVYGLPIVKGRLIESPDRKQSVAAYFATYTAVCKTGILVTPGNRAIPIAEYLPYAKDTFEPAVWQILCSNGTVFPNPVILDHTQKKKRT
jgi:hypothetical protein